MALDSRVVLLIGADTAVVDESSYARTLTVVGNAARTTAQAKYGAGSLTFDGTGDRITIADSADFSLFAGAFTVEGWFRFVTKTDNQALLGHWGSSNATSSWFFYVTGGTLLFRGVSGASLSDVSGTFTPVLGQWYHLAVDRSGSTVRVYVNGAVLATNAAYTANLNDCPSPFVLGAIGNLNSFPTLDFNGQMDEIRITNGLAQYAGAFTPPTGPFPRADLVTVPNVVGLTTAAAGTALTAAGLTTGTVGSAPSSTVAAGLVISQSPAAGTIVSPGAAVNLVVSTGPPSGYIKITINGGDVTTHIRSALGTIGPMKVNELSTAHFQFFDGTAPNRGDTLVAYALDGVTPIFGGLVRKRTTTSYANALTKMFTDCDVDDWWVYLDTSVGTSRVYGSPVTLKQALLDLVADCGLGAAGFTVDPAQVTGPTFAAFAWTQTGAAEAIRTLSTWSTSGSTSYVARISPTQVIKMFVPGTDPAPYTITTAAPHCEDVGWADPDALLYTKVALWCGPAGPIDYTQRWTQAGGATSWIADIPAANGITAGYVTVGGIFKTVATYGDPTADPASYTWEWPTRTLRLSLDTLPANGTSMVFVYSAASPFLVTSGTGSIVSTSYDETILTLADGQRTADGLLAKLHVGAKSWSILSHDHGWQPGQGISVALSAPAFTGTLTITDVTISLITGSIWKYRIDAAETVVYQGSTADQWRALGVGVPGGPPASSTLGGGTSGGLTQLTGDVTAGPGSGAEIATIANDAVTYAKFQNVSGASKLLGRGSAGGAGDVQELTLGTGLSMTGTTINGPRNSALVNYSYNSAGEPPNAGQIRTDFGFPWTATTKLWVRFVSVDDQDVYWGIMILSTGSSILVQDKDDHTAYARFVTTGAPIDKGLYAEIPVAHVSHGNSLIPAQQVLLQATAVSAVVQRRQVLVVLDGGGSVIAAGVRTFVSLPVGGTWKKWRIVSIDTAATAGSIVIDVWRDTYANYPPTVADTITASAKPTLSAANKAESSTLTGWTTAFAAGDVLGFNVDSATTVTKVELVLEFE